MTQHSPADERVGHDTGNALNAPRHPWHRWFARVWLDYVFAAFVLGVVLAVVAPSSSLLASDYALMWLAAVLWIPAEALLVASVGTTPGKYLVGMRITRSDGSLLSIAEAFTRAGSVWLIGCALMLPLVLLLTFNAQYNRLRKGKDSTWDERGRFLVTHTPLTPGRQLLLVFVVLAVLGLVVLGTMAAGAPR